MAEPLSEDGALESTGSSYGLRLVLTLVLVALFFAGQRVDLPQVHPERLPFAPPVPLTLLTLGFMPLITGFLLVELFSLTTSRGRRLRKGGIAGRARLDRAALITSLVTSAVQALGIALILEGSPSSGFEPVVDEPGWLFRLLMVATLTAVTAALFALGNLLSDHGIGNGFTLLILANVVLAVWRNEVAVRSELAEDTLPPALGMFVAAGLVALLVRYIRSTEAASTPPFPQGLVPLQWAIGILSIPWLVEHLSGQVGLFHIGFLASLLVLVAAFSWLSFQLFSSRGRVEANLPSTMEGISQVADTLERRLPLSTALLALGAVALYAWNSWQPHSLLTTWFTFLDLAVIVVIALDLWDQYRFLRRHGEEAHLVQLDNVHLSYRLAARLREEGIDVLARAQRYRALFFFFAALIKIDLFVPREQLDRAREIWAGLEAAPELIV